MCSPKVFQQKISQIRPRNLLLCLSMRLPRTILTRTSSQALSLLNATSYSFLLHFTVHTTFYSFARISLANVTNSRCLTSHLRCMPLVHSLQIRSRRLTLMSSTSKKRKKVSSCQSVYLHSLKPTFCRNSCLRQK